MLTDLMNAARAGDTETVTWLLDSHPQLLEERLDSGESPLMAAMYHGKIGIVDLLLTRGVPVNIHEAAALGDEEYIRYLLESDASQLEAYSFDGWTPLHLAAFFGGYQAARALLDLGAHVDARSTNKMANTPLHAAVAGRKGELVKLLLENKADPNAQQSGGFTSLHQAALHFDADMIKLLLEFGADPALAMEDGQTPADLARGKGFDELLPLLKQA